MGRHRLVVLWPGWPSAGDLARLSSMADNPLKRLLVQTSHYSVASLLTPVSGLVWLPLLTRIFSVADYGVMNLISATLDVSVALGKVGFQHSVVLIQFVESALFSFLRADQRTTTLMKYQVAKKYLGLGLILFAVFVVSRTLMAFYSPTLG